MRKQQGSDKLHNILLPLLDSSILEKLYQTGTVT